MSLWVSNSLYSFEYRHRRTYWCQDVVRQTAEYTSILWERSPTIRPCRVRRSSAEWLISPLSVVFGWSQLVLELVSKLVGAGLMHGGLLRAKVYIRKATIPEASPQSPIHIAHKATTSSNQLTVPSPTPPCPAPPPYPTFPFMTSTLEGRRSHSNSWMLP